MLYLTLADMVVIVHALFVLFVVFGGLAVLRWRRLAWLHLPSAVWGVMIEIGGWTCPLTYLENFLRKMGGGSGYSSSFIERYLEPLLYPPGITHHTQLFLGMAVFLVNFAVYTILWGKRRPPSAPRV
ncbi:MAG: DUF2784 domain-containing protein [Geobacteraceae bacterium]|nr:DUF2784 domain-containing protein [Geobacteraceae bacterium]